MNPLVTSLSPSTDVLVLKSKDGRDIALVPLKL